MGPNSKVKDIQEAMLTGGLSPHDMADARVILSAEYAFCSDQLETILSRKAALWLTLRLEAKSDASATKAYEMTADGLQEMQLRLKMKKIDKLQSALSSMLRVKENELKNQY